MVDEERTYWIEKGTRIRAQWYATKPVGLGTGLGLSISYGIIDSLGGSIGHRRAPAGGAIFYFELPATAPVHEHVAR